MSRQFIQASQSSLYSGQFDDPQNWFVVQRRHKNKLSADDADRLIEFNLAKSDALHSDPSLQVRSENAEVLRGYQLRCLRNPEFSHLLDNHPRYSSLYPHKGSFADWERQSLDLMPIPHFSHINNTPVVCSKQKLQRKRLPRAPRFAKQLSALELRADQGNYNLPSDHSEISRQISEFRSTFRLNQRKLADLLSVRLSELKLIESGKLIPDHNFCSRWDWLLSLPQFQITSQIRDDDIQESDLVDVHGKRINSSSTFDDSDFSTKH